MALSTLRQPAVALKLAIAFTVFGVLLLAPIYLDAQWAPAQSPTAPWYVALVREPFFWPLFGAAWLLAVAFWGVTFAGRRKAKHTSQTHSASPVPAASPSQDNRPQPFAA
jgi:hypothetical protein